jgi:hypothetical protein
VFGILNKSIQREVLPTCAHSVKVKSNGCGVDIVVLISGFAVVIAVLAIDTLYGDDVEVPEGTVILAAYFAGVAPAAPLVPLVPFVNVTVFPDPSVIITPLEICATVTDVPLVPAAPVGPIGIETAVQVQFPTHDVQLILFYIKILISILLLAATTMCCGT